MIEEIRTRIELAEAALEHTNVFKAEVLVRDARWLLGEVDRLSPLAQDPLRELRQRDYPAFTVGPMLMRLIVLGLRGDEDARKFAISEIESLRPTDATDPAAWANIWLITNEDAHAA